MIGPSLASLQPKIKKTIIGSQSVCLKNCKHNKPLKAPNISLRWIMIHFTRMVLAKKWKMQKYFEGFWTTCSLFLFYSSLKKQAVRPAAFWRTALIVRQPWKAPMHNVLFEQNVFLPTEQAQIYPEIHVSKYHSTFVPGCSHGRKTWFSRKLWIPNSESAISCII